MLFGDTPLGLWTGTIVELSHALARARTDEQWMKPKIFLNAFVKALEIHPLSIESAWLAGSIYLLTGNCRWISISCLVTPGSMENN